MNNIIALALCTAALGGMGDALFPILDAANAAGVDLGSTYAPMEAAWAMLFLGVLSGLTALFLGAAKESWKYAILLDLAAFVFICLSFVWFSPICFGAFGCFRSGFSWYHGVTIGGLINYLFAALNAHVAGQAK